LYFSVLTNVVPSYNNSSSHNSTSSWSGPKGFGL
jgi:hypothetical protein